MTQSSTVLATRPAEPAAAVGDERRNGHAKRTQAPAAAERRNGHHPRTQPAASDERRNGHQARTQELEDADAIGAYFQQIGTVRLLNAEEEVALAEQIAAGKRAAARLVEAAVDTGLRRELEGQRAAGQAARQRMVEAN